MAAYPFQFLLFSATRRCGRVLKPGDASQGSKWSQANDNKNTRTAAQIAAYHLKLYSQIKICKGFQNNPAALSERVTCLKSLSVVCKFSIASQL